MKNINQEYVDRWLNPMSFSELCSGQFEKDGIIFSVAGISFVKNINKKISYINEGDTVLFELVDDNEFDENAVRIIVVADTPKGKRKIPVGWIPKKINKNYRFEVNQGKTFFADVYSVFDGELGLKGDTKLNPSIKIEVFDFEEDTKTLDDFEKFIPEDDTPPF